tara:strand:- start:466 stop:981 length:516 start_codon:yes stop_codon:yes gene_type:complete
MDSKIIWFTGLSGAGKTTLSINLYKKLKKLKFKVKKIDGDIFRKKKVSVKSFTKKNIIENNIQIINYIDKVKGHYEFIIVSVISPLIRTRMLAKKRFGKNYHEIYVKCSVKVLVKRDTKGLYKLADQKIIKNLIGYNSKIIYEKSKYRKIIINTEKNNIENCINMIENKIL